MSDRKYSPGSKQKRVLPVTVVTGKGKDIDSLSTRMLNTKNRIAGTAERNESSGFLGKALNRGKLALSAVEGGTFSPAIRLGIKTSRIKKARKKKD
tara:strand:+ start:3858 stop:4145 length:288 start_codon:yes stop_codon:yes gene_type:complete